MKFNTSFIMIFFLLIPTLNIRASYETVNISASSETVRGNYQNHMVLPPGKNPPVNKSTTAVFFSGHIGEQVKNQSVILSQSSFCQAFSSDVPYVNFRNDILTKSLQMLYYEYADSEDERKEAAFAYKAFLYKRENANSESYIRAQIEITDWWDENRNKKASNAAEIIKSALKYRPYDKELRWTLLDIYYDIALANLTLAREKNVEAYKLILGIDPASTSENNNDSNEFVIHQEIIVLEESLELYRNSLKGYFDLLNNHLGVNVATFDPEAPDNIAFGYYIFQKETPERSLDSPLRIDSNGKWVLPKEDSEDCNPYEIIDGYKDLKLLFDIQKEYVECAATLAKRYMQRNAKDDIKKAKELIGKVEQASYIEGNILLNIFPNCLDPSNKSTAVSVLSETISRWRHQLTELSFLHTYINGEKNILGFSNDFLVLVQSIVPGNPEYGFFDTYNYLASYMYDTNSPLTVAVNDKIVAKNNYENYRDRNDQLAMQFKEKNELYNNRLRQIVGVAPGESGYNTPYENIGSELYLQTNAIDRAVNRIKRYDQELKNIEERIKIEIWRRGEEKKINNAISQVIVKYGNKQVALTKEIAEISEEQANASIIASSISGLLSSIISKNPAGAVGGIVSAINGLFQKDREKEKSEKQARKEKYAALERAEIVILNDQLQDIISQANIKNLLLNMKTLEIDSHEQKLVLEQESARLTALINEKNYLERQKVVFNTSLSDRYFADPTHRLLKDISFDRAEQSFQNAQKWLFFTVRALEYRWNTKFNHFFKEKTYTTETLFALRNADELKDMCSAMKDFNDNVGVGLRCDDGYKKFSYKEDFLGYNSGTKCIDPVTNERVDDDIAFQSYLSQESLYIESDDPKNNFLEGFKVIRLPFSTASTPKNGGMFMKHSWLEKIKHLKVRVFGGSNSEINGYLKYGGLSYIRKQSKGVIDPQNPLRIMDEMTIYSTRYWFYDIEKKSWSFKNAFSSPITVYVSNDPEMPDSVKEIDTFKEYSVAASEWVLYLAVEKEDNVLLDVSEIADIEIHFYYYWYSRPIDTPQKLDN